MNQATENLTIRSGAALTPEQVMAAQRLAVKYIPRVNTTEISFVALRRNRVVAALFGCVALFKDTQTAAFQIDAVVVVPELRRLRLASKIIQHLETSNLLREHQQNYKVSAITGQVIHPGSMLLMQSLGYTIHQEKPTDCPTCSKQLT
jgi:hypothetical protein